MATIVTIKDCQSMELALRFIKHKARTSIVEVSTGLSKNIIRKLYREMHDEKPASGQLPQSIQPFMNLPQSRLQIQVFFSLYKSMYGDKVLRRMFAEELLTSYEVYLSTLRSPRIEPVTITECWVFVRDLRSNMLLVSQCDSCSSDYIDHTMLNQGICPACEIKESMYCKTCDQKLHRVKGCLTCKEESRLTVKSATAR